ncbi:MAG: hypothetical protein ABL881_04365 [Novosphingobium sp.]
MNFFIILSPWDDQIRLPCGKSSVEVPHTTIDCNAFRQSIAIFAWQCHNRNNDGWNWLLGRVMGG